MARSVKRLTSAQVMIPPFVSSRPVLGFVVTSRSLEPASHALSPSLSASPLPGLSLCLTQKEINVKKKKKVEIEITFPKTF